MDLNKIEKLVSRLKHTELLQKKGNEKSYQTSHEDYNVDISQTLNAGYVAPPIYGTLDWDDNARFKFKSKSGNDEFIIDFLNYQDCGELYKRIQLSVNNLVVRDNEVIDKMLQKVKFENLIDKELENVNAVAKTISERKEQQQLNEQTKIEEDVKNLISNLDVNSQSNEIDFNILKKTIDELSHKTNHKYISESASNMFNYSKPYNHESTYTEKFENFEITFKENYSFDSYGINKESTNTELHFKNQSENIDLCFKISPSFKSLGLVMNDKLVNNSSLEQELFIKIGAEKFLNSLLDKVSTLNLAESAQWQINKSISQIKLEDLLTDNPNDKKINLDNMPIDINGAKVWINKELQLDRKDGPAIENYEGKDFWFNNGNAIMPIVPNKVDTSPISVVVDVINKFRNMFSQNSNKNKNNLN